MKNILFSLILLFGLNLISAQSDIIAVSGKKGNKIDFQDFRFINFNDSAEKIITKKNLDIPEQVVGMTYDVQKQKLLFIGMHSPDIYSYDLNTKNFQRIYAAGRAFSTCALKEQFSRMATSSEGVSYALSNSSNQLIEIRSLSSGYAVEELGALTSDVNLDQYKFYGGDLIANDNNEMFLISAYRHILKINPKSLKAEYIGEIQGIEKSFTTNGSAVLSTGEVLLTNAKGLGAYSLDFSTLQAKPLLGEQNYAIYDLASPYLLQSDTAMATLNKINIYPSKIINGQVSVQVINELQGMGKVMIYDIAGNVLIDSSLDLTQSKAIKKFNLQGMNPGNYYIKVIDANGVELANEKVILLR